MRKILYCEFNLDTACVELGLEDGMLLSIDCTTVEINAVNYVDFHAYEHKAKITILQETEETFNYLSENNLLQYTDLEKKVEDIHSTYAHTGEELKSVETRLREIQPLIKNHLQLSEAQTGS